MKGVKIMFKTEVVKSIKDIDLRAQMVTDMINEQTKIGWDYHSGIATHKYSVMLIF